MIFSNSFCRSSSRTNSCPSVVESKNFFNDEEIVIVDATPSTYRLLIKLPSTGFYFTIRKGYPQNF